MRISEWSSDVCSSDHKENEYQCRILKEFDKELAVDMESYGLARGVYNARSTRHYNLNYLIVRGISDLVDQEGNNEQRIKWRGYAAATAAAFTVSVCDEIGRASGRLSVGMYV